MIKVKMSENVNFRVVAFVNMAAVKKREYGQDKQTDGDVTRVTCSVKRPVYMRVCVCVCFAKICNGFIR